MVRPGLLSGGRALVLPGILHCLLPNLLSQVFQSFIQLATVTKQYCMCTWNSQKRCWASVAHACNPN
jgi:hypothetical protein